MVTRVLPPEVLDALPEQVEHERDWQNALVLALPHLLPVFLYRQNAGRVVTKHGSVVKGAPAGAADIAGWETVSGIALQIECKMYGEEPTATQKRWRTHCVTARAIYRLAVYDPGFSLLENIGAEATRLRALLAKRGIDA